jgi:hypothetical protein
MAVSRETGGVSTLQKMGLLIVGALLLVYLGLSVMDTQETRDAELVESVQVTLQSTVSKGVVALQIPATEIHPMNIINAARINLPKGIQMDKSLRLLILRSGREAQFSVTQAGDLFVVSLKNFSRYHVENGRIVRSNSWVIQLPTLMDKP